MKPHMGAAQAAAPEWGKSSYSGAQGDCVEIATLPDGTRLLRDSKRPHGPVLTLPTGPFDTFLRGLSQQ